MQRRVAEWSILGAITSTLFTYARIGRLDPVAESDITRILDQTLLKSGRKMTAANFQEQISEVYYNYKYHESAHGIS